MAFQSIRSNCIAPHRVASRHSFVQVCASMTGITKLHSLQYNSYIPTLPDVRLLFALSLRKTSVDAKGCSELDLPSFAPNRPQRTQRIDAMRYDTIFLRTTHISLFRFALQHHPSTPHRFAAFMATRHEGFREVDALPCHVTPCPGSTQPIQIWSPVLPFRRFSFQSLRRNDTEHTQAKRSRASIFGIRFVLGADIEVSLGWSSMESPHHRIEDVCVH